VLGGPGSGKGTNCERIAKDYGYMHLSTGDLLRAEVKSGSALGKELDAVMKTGGLVDSSMMLRILKGAMTEGNTKPVSGRYLIDGYPRALDQVASFEAAICKPTLVLAFDAKEEVLEARLLNRGKASGRADDQNVEAIRARFATFKKQSEPVIAIYSGEGLVKALNSERPVDDVYADCKPIFKAELARMSLPVAAVVTSAIKSPTSVVKAPAAASPRVAPEGAAPSAPPAGCCTIA
jgi:adenylate kinase family enzyme